MSRLPELLPATMTAPRPPAPAFRLAAVYLVAQAVLVALWWVGLLAWPVVRRWFVPPGSPETDLLAFLLPDLAVLAAGSLVAGGAALRARRGSATAGRVAVAAAWLTAGAATYAALYCVGWLALTGAPWLAVLAMLPAAAATWAAAVAVQRGVMGRGRGGPRR